MPEGSTRLEETFQYRCYLSLSSMMGTLRSDHLGSDGDYDDSDYFEAHLTELFGADIDKVFTSQHVDGVFGEKRWAFTGQEDGFRGDDLEARLFHDRDFDVYYLVHRPTNSRVDYITNGITGLGAGVPDKYHQAAQLVELVRPEFRDKVVLSGFSLGGGLAAYAAFKASWMVRAIVFDPVGLNRKMMGESGVGLLGQHEVLSERYRSMDDFVGWYYIANSWVARINVERHLSSLGRVTELPQDPVRAKNNPDTHDFRHVRFGLHKRWGHEASGPADETSATSRPSSRRAGRSRSRKHVHAIRMESASSTGPPDWYIMNVVRGSVLEPLTTREDYSIDIGGDFVWSYPDVPDEVWEHKVRPVIEPRINRLIDRLKIMSGSVS